MASNQLREIRIQYNPPEQPQLKTKVANSEEAYRVLLADWNLDVIDCQEEFKVLMLNRSNEVLGIYPQSKGGISTTIVDVRLVFSVALKCLASTLILAHNHPSGSLLPSHADIQLTRKLTQAGKLLEIPVVDHLIVTREGYYSFADQGTL
jgi:DNA repair protein RadC